MARPQENIDKPALQKERLRKIRDVSPYSKNFKCYIKSDERDLIYKRQMVTKLPRKELEDRYIELCDENFFIKRHNNELLDKIKELTTKVVRISCAPRSYSSTAILRERTSENIGDSSRLHPAYTKPMVRSSSLNTVYRRNIRSATPSEGSKSASSSSNSHRTAGSTRNEINQKSEKGMTEVSEKDITNQQEANTLRKKVEELTEAVKSEREKSEHIELEKKKVESRLNDVDMKKFLVENIEVNRLKRKLEQVRGAVKRMQLQHKQALILKEELIEAERKKFDTIKEQLNDEQMRQPPPLADKKCELKTALRTIEMLRKQISELEFDKKRLADQQESLSKLLREAASNEKENIPSSSDDQALLLQSLEKLKTEKAAIENSKNELFLKIRDLQDMNDRLVVDLEGLKTLKTYHDDILKSSGNSANDEVIVLLSQESEVTVS